MINQVTNEKMFVCVYACVRACVCACVCVASIKHIVSSSCIMSMTENPVFVFKKIIYNKLNII